MGMTASTRSTTCHAGCGRGAASTATSGRWALGELVVTVGADQLYPLVSGGGEIADGPPNRHT